MSESKDSQGNSFVYWHGGSDSHPNSVESTDEENGGGDWPSKWILEFVDRLKEWHCQKTNWHGSHRQHSDQLVWNDSQSVESWEEVPLRQDFQRSSERISWLTQLGWLHHS